MITKKHIVLFDLLLVVGTLVTIAFFVGYSQPLVIAPLDGEITTQTKVLFAFDKADTILIDDNLEFTSPTTIHAEDSLVITLEPGVYYWKVVGAQASEVRTLTIESSVDLQLRATEDSYSVVNAGNAPLDVSVYERDEFKEKIILDVSEAKEVAGDRVIGYEGS